MALPNNLMAGSTALQALHATACVTWPWGAMLNMYFAAALLCGVETLAALPCNVACSM
jgi:hypothetical protein